jgi:hypothetical protein
MLAVMRSPTKRSGPWSADHPPSGRRNAGSSMRFLRPTRSASRRLWCVPRTEVHFLRGRLPVNQAVKEVLEGRHSRYPVIGTSVDDIIGFVHIRAPFWYQQ